MGIVGCRQDDSYIYTECIGNNSRGEGGCRDETQVLMNRIENVAIHRRKQEAVGMGGKYSCKQVHNLQPADDVVSPAEDIQHYGKIITQLQNLVRHIKGKEQAELFENRVLRKTFGLEREEVTGDGRKLYTEEIHDCNTSRNTREIIEDRQPLPFHRKKTPR